MTPPHPVRRRDDCRLCHGTSLHLALSLTPTPPANALLPAPDPTAPSFPLDLVRCDTCGHAQLAHVVDPRVLFGEYRYMTGASPSLRSYADVYASEVLALAGLQPGASVLEIGSNDGTQLDAFRRRGYTVLGVDPAPIPARQANERGVPTIRSFFDESVAGELRARGPFDLVIANNVMAHIDDLDEVMRVVSGALQPSGTFVMEVGYVGDILRDTLFDVIYHEHVSYHSVAPLVGFFARHGFTLQHVQHTPMQGGSIRVYAAGDGGAPSESVSQAIAEERRRGLLTAAPFAEFAAAIDRLQGSIGDVLGTIPGSARIWGYGAAAKATTMMYHFDLASRIEFIVDDNEVKQDLFTPGHGIPVGDPALIYQKEPEYLFLFAWNYADDILSRHAAYLRGGGKVIVPLPDVRVVAEPAAG